MTRSNAHGLPAQIAEAFRRFGISDQTRDLIAVKITRGEDPEGSKAAVASTLAEAVQGDPVPFDDETLEATADVAAIAKGYKLGTTTSQPSQPDSKQRADVEAAALAAMALRGAS